MGLYRVFIKYSVFSKILKYIPDSGLSRFPLSVCTQWQVKHQRCSKTCRVQENHNILRKNTIFNEHPVIQSYKLWNLLYCIIELRLSFFNEWYFLKARHRLKIFYKFSTRIEQLNRRTMWIIILRRHGVNVQGRSWVNLRVGPRPCPWPKCKMCCASISLAKEKHAGGEARPPRPPPPQMRPCQCHRVVPLHLLL